MPVRLPMISESSNFHMKTIIHPDYWVEIPAGEYLTGFSEQQRELILSRFIQQYGANAFSTQERQLLDRIIAKMKQRAEVVNRDPIAAGSYPLQLTDEELTLFRSEPFSKIASFADNLVLRPSQRAIWVDRFYISRFPITDEQFIAFDQGIAAANVPGVLEWPTERVLEDSTKPEIRQMIRQSRGRDVMIAGRKVSATDRKIALRFCQSLGARLPTPQEWEKAARGTDGRLYPWGNQWRPNAGYFHRDQPVSGRNRVDAFPEGVSPYGVWAMMGNLPEMVMARSFWPSVAPQGSHPRESSEPTAWLDYMIGYYRKGDWVSFRPVLSHWPKQHWPGFRAEANQETTQVRQITLSAELPAVIVEMNQTVISSDNLHRLTPIGELVIGTPYRVEVTSHVRQLVWSPTGETWLAVATRENLWLRHLRTTTTHLIDQCWEMTAYSPDSAEVVAAGLDQQSLHIFDSKTGKEMRTFTIPRQYISSLTFNPDKTLLAAANDKGQITLRDCVTGAELSTWLGHTDAVKKIVFNATGSLLASAGMDGTIRLWEVSRGRQVALLTQQDFPMYDVAFSPDGTTLAAAAANGSIFLWHLKHGPEPHILPEPDDNLAAHVSFSPDGRLLAGGYSNGMFKVWSTATSELLTTINCDMGWVINVAFSPDGKLLAIGSQTVVLWGIPSEE